MKTTPVPHLTPTLHKLISYLVPVVLCLAWAWLLAPVLVR